MSIPIMMKKFIEWGKTEKCTMLQVINGNNEFFEPLGFEKREIRFHQVKIKNIAP